MTPENEIPNPITNPKLTLLGIDFLFNPLGLIILIIIIILIIYLIIK